MPRRYESAVKNMKKKKITASNKTLILEFDRYLKVNMNITLTRRIKYVRILTTCAEFLGKDFKKASFKDIQMVVEKIEDSNWASATKKDYKMLLKRYYKYLLGKDVEYPPNVKWIKARLEYNIHTRKEELLTEDDIQKMLAVAQNYRDKAFIHVLYESGGRIGEIGTLRIKDVNFDNYGVQINVNGKTGERPIRLVKSASDLSYWVRHHPNNNPDAPLWCVFRDPKECLKYSAYVKIIKTHFKLAKIDKVKKCNPHSFRHATLTRLSSYLSDQEIKIYAGWEKTSTMVDTYMHLSGGDVSNKILKINGIKKEDNEVEDKPLLCWRCNSPNPKHNQFCYNCNNILDEKLSVHFKQGEEWETKIRSNPEALELMQKLVLALEKS